MAAQPQDPEITVAVQQHGPDDAALDRAWQEALRSRPLQAFLQGAAYRLLSLQAAAGAEAKTARPPALNRFVAEVYDYTNERNLTVQGALGAGDVVVEESSRQPLPNDDEFDAAASAVVADQELGALVRREQLVPYRPMPPLLPEASPDGRVERTLAVGLVGEGERVRHRLVGAKMRTGAVLRDMPGIVQSSAGRCGPPPASCAQRGNAGQAWITVKQGGTTVWRFLAVRPAASSGTNGSAIELRYVDYRGRRVLYQAHVPILNILYSSGGPGGCGPSYRDWQNGEVCFQADGTDVTPGFRLCPAPAQTILDTGADGGNFRGVAIYVQGSEVVLVSVLSAGWYRYISEWRLAADGTIRPRFGFAATDNSCTCHLHTHHAYWRLDFDIETPSNNLVEEFNDPPLFPPHHWHRKRYEIRRPRNPATARRWRVTNAGTHRGYEIVPGPADGVADAAYGIGDLWVLRWHPGEIDDGQGFTTDPGLSMEHIDRFVNGEVVEDRDVVLWYSAHFRHDPAHGAGEWVGPELRRI